MLALRCFSASAPSLSLSNFSPTLFLTANTILTTESICCNGPILHIFKEWLQPISFSFEFEFAGVFAG